MSSPSSPLTALLDPRHRITCSLSGTPALMRTTVRWDTGLRTLDEHLIYAVVGGSARLETGGRHHLLDSHSLIIIPPGCPFRLRVHLSPPVIMRVRLRVMVGRAPGAAWACLPHALVRADARAIRPWLEQLIDTTTQPTPDREPRTRALALLILSEAMRDDTAVPLAGRFEAHHRRRILALLEGPHRRQLQPRQLALHLGLSLDYFTRSFRRSFGTSPRAYLVRQRIRASCMDLIAGSQAIAEVAARCGYRDVNLYSRQFRRIMGVPPGRFRAQHGADGGL